MNDLETLPKKNKPILAAWDLSEVEDEMEAQMYWSDFVEEVEEVMKKLKTNDFFAYVLSLTWRNVAGYTTFSTSDAEQLIRKLAPNSGEFTMLFHPTEDKNVIEVVISHHDRPMGETLYLMSQKTEKKLGILKEYF